MALNKGDVTRLMQEWAAGADSAQDALFPVIYEELRRLARSHLRREKKNFTLDNPAALINEAYLRLNRNRPNVECREQFNRIAWRVMDQVLKDHADYGGADKRFPRHLRVIMTLDRVGGPHDASEAEAVKDALIELKSFNPLGHTIIMLLHEEGLTQKEVADRVGLSLNKTRAAIQAAEAWLKARFKKKSA